MKLFAKLAAAAVITSTFAFTGMTAYKGELLFNIFNNGMTAYVQATNSSTME